MRLALLLLVVSCVSQQTAPPASPAVAPAAATPTATPTASPTPSPPPTPDVIAQDFLRILALRDEAQVRGDEKALLAILDQSAPPAFREREIGLLRATHDRGGTAPTRTLPRRAGIDDPNGVLQYLEVAESDDQGRTRRVRYFLNTACCSRLTELVGETADRSMGPLRTRSDDGYTVVFRDIDAKQAAAADAYAKAAIASLVARLGEPYRPTRPITITLTPTTVPDLPAQASGYTNGPEITLLSSVSMVVASGPGAEWSRTVVTHEISHVLLFANGTGPWAIAEGIPLWLTDDRRQPELDRIVRANAVWDLPHLLGGPRTDAEFYAGYAQASSFVRYLAATYGDRAVIALWEARPSSETMDRAFRAAFGAGSADAYTGWRLGLRPSALRAPAFQRAA